MDEAMQDPSTIRHLPFGRVTVSALAIGGLTGSFLAIGTAGAASHRAAKSVVVSTVANPTLGKILVSGKTLYTLKASSIACSSACLKVWPALSLPKGTKKAKAGSGVKGAKLGTVKRKGGLLQVTYAGKALYRFVGDTAAGQVNGSVTDKWGTWTPVVTAAVKSVAPPSSTTPSTSSTSPTAGSPTGGTSATTTTKPTPTTTPPTTPPTTTTTPTTAPPTTTTTAPASGGGVGF